MVADSALAEAKAAMRLADLQPGRAVPAAAEAVRRALRERDPRAAALAEQAWGHALLQCSEVGEAVRHLRRAVRHGERAGWRALAGESRMKLAFALVQRGSSRAALREIDVAVRELDGIASGKALAQRAVIRYHVGRLDEAAVDYQAAVRELRRGDDRLGLQRALMNRGILHAERSEFDAAVRDLNEADVLARDLGRDLVVGIIAENLGFVESQRGDVPAALAWLGRAEEIIGAHGGQLAPVLQDRAELLLSVGLVTEARRTAERAVGVFAAENRRLKVPEMRLLLAQIALLDGQWTTAAEQARTALRAFTGQGRDQWAALARSTELRARLGAGERSRVGSEVVEAMVSTLDANGRPLAAVQARVDAARLAELRGRPAVAAAHLAVAARAARGSGPATLRARGWYAEALRRRGQNPRGALTAARTGLRILDDHHAALGASDLRAYSASHRADLAGLGLRIALDQGGVRGIFEWAERGRASRSLHRSALPPDDPELAGLLPRLRATSGALEQARAAGEPTGRLRHRQVELERRIRDRSRLLPAAAGTAAVPRPVPVGDLAGALGERALVEFVEVDGTLLGLCLVEGRLRLHTLGSAAEVAGLLDRIPFALRKLAGSGEGRSRVPVEQLLHSAAARLDAVVLGPLNELGDRPLVVVPTGVLHNVPWAVLPSCAGRPVAVSPSATLWHAAATRPPGPAREVAVAGGPGLPGAREEALAVAEIHRGTALVDEAATVEAVLAALTTAGTVHLAAHGRLAVDNPLFSALRLHDGPLLVHDVRRLPRVPETVLLAACDVGRSVVCPGNELLGLGAAFIERGTAQLVASVVPVPDLATTSLMTEVHRRLAAGEAPAAALASAQQKVAADGPAELAASAGFVCVGAGSR
ncbi:CHAT domain-containing protein [Amycolatopsis sp. NPDC048633]|uniref:CHAT domain-containing protein n=1 Tax=Amycolatopsis sp. NPDC048633 TaxID=3157095 RepID=UPI00340076A0